MMNSIIFLSICTISEVDSVMSGSLSKQNSQDGYNTSFEVGESTNLEIGFCLQHAVQHIIQRSVEVI